MRVSSLVSKEVPRPGPTPPNVDRARGDSEGGLSSRDPRHPDFTAISWVVLQEVKSDAAMALLRLELLRRQQQEPAIARAIEFLRSAVTELDTLAGGSDRLGAGPAKSSGKSPDRSPGPSSGAVSG
jgi:hypothetical protein